MRISNAPCPWLIQSFALFVSSWIFLLLESSLTCNAYVSAFSSTTPSFSFINFKALSAEYFPSNVVNFSNVPTVAGVKASIVVCDLGALTCVDMTEITVLNRNDPALDGYVLKQEAKMPRIID